MVRARVPDELASGEAAVDMLEVELRRVRLGGFREGDMFDVSDMAEDGKPVVEEVEELRRPCSSYMELILGREPLACGSTRRS